MTYREHTLAQLALAQIPHRDDDGFRGWPAIHIETEEGQTVTMTFDYRGILEAFSTHPTTASTSHDTGIVTFLYRHGQRVQLPQHGGVGEIVLQRLTRRAVLGDVVEYAVQCPDGEVVWHYEPDLVAVEGER